MKSRDTAQLLVICGPTASGKTGAAIRACQELGGEVLSCDAVQIYRGLDIGSAKPTSEEQAAAPHHLIDIAEPSERFSAAKFAKAADAVIGELVGSGRVPVVAGGSGLYLKSLVWGLMPAPPADAEVRARLDAVEEEEGVGTLHARLADVDPESAARLHPADRMRIVRALEVLELTGKTISAHQAAHGFAEVRYRAVIWGIDPGREALNERINRRVDVMFDAGLIAEVEGLLARGFGPGDPGLQSPGYREILAYLAGELPLDEARRLIARNHRRYARRQRTWFKKTPGIRWFASGKELPLADWQGAGRGISTT